MAARWSCPHASDNGTIALSVVRSAYSCSRDVRQSSREDSSRPKWFSRASGTTRDDASVTDGAMDNQPRVSVVMIFLDAERFIEEAIESIRAQRLTDWELILVDDGSIDGSAAIARRYGAEDPARIRYLHHPHRENRGMSASRNLGIRLAHGEFLAFLDADDVSTPDQLLHQVAELEAHPEAEAVYGCLRIWNSWPGNPDKATKDYITGPTRPPGMVMQPPEGLKVLTRPHFFGICSIMLRRDFVVGIGGFEEEFRDLHEDTVFHTKVFANAPVLISASCWAWYRQHPGSTVRKSHSSVRWHIEEAVRYGKWRSTYLARQAIDDDEVTGMIKNSRTRSSTPLRYIAWHPARVIGRILPDPARRVLAPIWRRFRQRPPVGTIDFGDLRRKRPISGDFGSERGTTIDRHYIEGFLAEHAHFVKGRVLEIGDNVYTKQFGQSRVTTSDILHVHDGNKRATFVDDLARGDTLPSNEFDCVILTQTLQLIYDVPAAIRTLHRILKPSGVLLATFPGLSQIPECEWSEHWYWGFTSRSALRLFRESFPDDCVEVRAHGNVLASAGFLYGFAVEELELEELDYRDPDYELVITVKAQKPARTVARTGL